MNTQEKSKLLDDFYMKYRTITREDISIVHYNKLAAQCNFQQLTFIGESEKFLMETPLKWWNSLAGDERERFLILLEA